MSEFTPNTDEVRYHYAFCIGVFSVYSKSQAAEFDRWLARHDAEVAEAERERIIDLLDDEVAMLIAQDDMGSPLLVFLSKFIDKLEGDNE